MRYDPLAAQLTLDRHELTALAEQHDALEPRVERAVRGAVFPHRCTVIEHVTADGAAAIRVGWTRDGRATVTTGHDELTITATRLGFVPAILAQFLRLEPRPVARGRIAIVTDAGSLDDAFAAPSRAGAGVAALVTGFECAWRATGGWADRATDRTITVIDTGEDGLWVTTADASPHRDTTRATTCDTARDTAVTFRPITSGEAFTALGDVVTGRRVSEHCDTVVDEGRAGNRATIS